MHDKPPLRPETYEGIRAFCEKMSVAHGLDEEIQKELRGHMEDKVLAYLLGEEPLTEGDAMLLAREHFGDLKVIKSLLSQVHSRAANISLLRRLGALCIASLATSVVLAVVGASLTVAVVAWSVWISPSNVLNAVNGFAGVVASIGQVALLWWIVCRWQRKLDAGETLWFTALNPAFLAVLILFLAAALGLFPFLTTAPGAIGPELEPGLRHVLSWVVTPFILSVWISRCLIWLWWCDRKPRRPLAGAWAFAGWFIYSTSVVRVSTLLPRVQVHFDTLSGWHLIDTRWDIGERCIYFAGDSITVFAHTLIIGVSAIVLYILAQGIRHSHMKRLQRS